MPIQFNLQDLKKETGCTIYLETGLYDPATDISCKKALLCDFDKVYSIEIRNDFYEKAKDIFKAELDSGKLILINDDSTNMLSYILGNSDFSNKTIFFLDAHVDNVNIHNYKKRCPLFEELNAIKALERNDHIILIDDVRILKENNPWYETSYGNIDYIQTIQELIITINPNYKFKYLNGVIENDVMLAYL